MPLEISEIGVLIAVGEPASSVESASRASAADAGEGIAGAVPYQIEDARHVRTVLRVPPHEAVLEPAGR